MGDQGNRYVEDPDQLTTADLAGGGAGRDAGGDPERTAAVPQGEQELAQRDQQPGQPQQLGPEGAAQITGTGAAQRGGESPATADPGYGEGGAGPGQPQPAPQAGAPSPETGPGYAAAPSAASATPAQGPAGAGGGDAGGPPELVDHALLDQLHAQWASVQASFVDDPQRAVRDADHLVAEVIKSMTEVFARGRQQLEASWGRGEMDTEGLRQLMRRYRALFDVLLQSGGQQPNGPGQGR